MAGTSTSTDFLSSITDQWHEALSTFSQGRIEESLRRFRHIIQLCKDANYRHPRSAFLWANAAILRWTLGEIRGARRHIQNAIHLDRNPILLYMGGCVAWELREYGEAAEAFGACLVRFRGEGEGDAEEMGFRDVGLDYVLVKGNVRFNWEICANAATLAAGEEMDRGLGIYQFPGSLLFAPGAIEEQDEDDQDAEEGGEVGGEDGTGEKRTESGSVER